VIAKLEPDLFLTITGLKAKDFYLIVNLKVFNSADESGGLRFP